MSWTEGKVADILADYFAWQRNVIIPNYQFMGWESDLLVFRPTTRILDEVEIKVSLQNLHREFKRKHSYNDYQKTRKHRVYSLGEVRHPISRFWLAVPSDMEGAALAVLPSWAGLLVVEGQHARKIKHAPLLPNSTKVDDGDALRLIRTACTRFWRARLFGQGGRK